MLQKIFFPNNVKLLRKRKNITQETMAKALDISRAKLAAIELGQTNPQLDDLVQFSNYFQISIDSLLKMDLAKLGAYKLRQLETGNDVYMTGSQIRVLAITVNSNNKENVEYVPIKAKAGYPAGCSDPDFIAALPKFSMPNLPSGKSYRVFPTRGDSMLPIPEGSDIIAEYVQDWKHLKPKTPCVVILKGNQDFVFKQVTVHDDGRFLMESLNDIYPPYTVEAGGVLEIWKYYKHQTNVLPDKETDLRVVLKEVQEIKAKLSSK
jgi:transcriptional regulator with XRE-family HTH domain